MLRGAWGVFLGGQRATTCPVAETRSHEVFLSQETETPLLIDVTRCPVVGRNTLKHSKTYRRGKPMGRAPVVQLYTCPVAAEIAPDILGQQTKTPFHFLYGAMRIPLAFRAVQNIVQMDVRIPGLLG